MAMKKLIGAMCIGVLGAFAFAPAAQAGSSFDFEFFCDVSGDTHLVDHFCDGTALYQVTVNCMNLEPDIYGALLVDTGFATAVFGSWDFLVQETRGTVCEASGFYGDLLKTELKCTDAPKGSNGRGKDEHDDEFAQADFEIKLIDEEAEECESD